MIESSSGPDAPVDDATVLPSGPIAAARARASKRRLVIAASAVGVVAFVCLVVVMVAVSGGGDADSDSAGSRLTSTTRPRGNTTNDTGPDNSGTGNPTTTLTGGSTTQPRQSATNPPTTTPAPVPVPGFTVKVNTCLWDADNEELFAGGFVTSRTNSTSNTVDLEVEFYDGSELLTSAADILTIEPGQTVSWEVTDLWSDTPSALRCNAIVLN